MIAAGGVSRRRALVTLAASARESSRRRTNDKANVALIGAGWWAQGWHLPHLHRNDAVNIAAIVDMNPHPRSNLNPNLEPLSALADAYGCPVFESVPELLADKRVGPNLDGAIVSTPHSTHFHIGKLLLLEGMRRRLDANSADDAKPMNVLMEKPMTTNVHQARRLHDFYHECVSDGERGCFLVNHSANYRAQARAARDLIQDGAIGKIQHVTGFLASPLSWIFDDPANTGWNQPDMRDKDMVGNGFAWGQSTHLLAWIYHAAGKDEYAVHPSRVYAAMTQSRATGADVSHAATVTCTNGATLSLSGTSLLPGNAHSNPPVGKQIRIKMFGTRGALMYNGDDRDPDSGRLELRRGGDEDGNDVGAVEVHCPDLGFAFEDLEPEGMGPESLQAFLDACLGREYYVGADSDVGLRTVQTIDAMYRSHVSGNAEDVLCSSSSYSVE